MKIINITNEQLQKMHILKEDNVFLDSDIVYKIDSESEEIIKKIISLGNHPSLTQLAKPIDILQSQKQYLGYTMQYYKNLQELNQALKNGTIKKLGDYFDELFKITTKLNLLKLIYWDFHDKNILVDKNGKPFIIDLDDITDEISDENLIEQKEYLCEFLIGTYIKKYKGFCTFFRTDAFNKILNKEANEYLEGIYQRDYSIIDMPYAVLTELEDPEKTNALKLALK